MCRDVEAVHAPICQTKEFMCVEARHEKDSTCRVEEPEEVNESAAA